MCLKFNVVTDFCPLWYRFAKTSASSTSSASLSASPSPLQGSLNNTLDSSGDTFADASDHFPSPEGGGLSAVAHALKYTEAAYDVSEDVQAGTTDLMDTGEGEGQVEEACLSSSTGASGLSRSPLKDTSSSSDVGDTLLHLSLESAEEELPEGQKQEVEEEESFSKSLFEEQRKPSPQLIRHTLQRSNDSQPEQKSSFWEPKKTTVSLFTPLLQQQPRPSSSHKPTITTLKSYRFISEGMRERMLSPGLSLQSTPVAAPPSNTSTPQRPSLSATTSGSPSLTSFGLSAQYSFCSPAVKSPPPTEPLETKTVVPSEDTPVKPFVFSPPFTRSASMERKSLEFSRTTPLLGASGKQKR